MTFQQLLEQNEYSTLRYAGYGMAPNTTCLGVKCDNPVKTAFEIGLIIPMNKIEPWNYRNTVNINWADNGRGENYIIYWPFIPFEIADEETDQ